MSKLVRIGFAGTSFRAPEGSVLTDDQIARYAPSALAVDKHVSRSERYNFLSTADVIRYLRTLGFYPVFVAQGGSRVEGKKEYTKHCVRLRHESMKSADGTAIEILVYNSHDGTCSWVIWLGALRAVCMNGLAFGKEIFSGRIQHSKRDAREMVAEACHNAIGAGNGAIEAIESMRATILLPSEARAIANIAVDMRFSETIERTGHRPISVDQALAVNRREDNKPDLYTVFNTIQENLVRGGIHYTTQDANGRRRHGTTREVTGIDGNRTLNQKLFTLAERYGAMRRGEINEAAFAAAVAG